MPPDPVVEATVVIVIKTDGPPSDTVGVGAIYAPLAALLVIVGSVSWGVEVTGGSV